MGRGRVGGGSRQLCGRSCGCRCWHWPCRQCRLQWFQCTPYVSVCLFVLPHCVVGWALRRTALYPSIAVRVEQPSRGRHTASVPAVQGQAAQGHAARVGGCGSAQGWSCVISRIRAARPTAGNVRPVPGAAASVTLGVTAAMSAHPLLPRLGSTQIPVRVVQGHAAAAEPD